MTRLFVDGLPLQVQTNTREQPAIFKVNDHRFVVERIVQHWEVDTDWWTAEGRVWRRHWALTTCDNGDEAGMFCVISYDVLSDEWRLDRIYD